MKNPAFKGVIPALTMPFREDRSIDLDGFRRLIEHVIGDGVNGLLVNGCTGESWAVTDDERAAIFRAAVQQAAGRVPVVAGVGAILPDHVKARIRQAADAGCDYVMIQAPYYVLPNLDEVGDFFRDLLDYTPLPAVIYNIPRRTGVNLSVELVHRLADHPRAAALKESSKDFLLLSEMIRRTGDRLSVFAGYASLLGLGAITQGAVGYMDSSTPVFGAKSPAFYRAAAAGDLDTARRLQGEMVELNNGFFGIGTFPAGVKAALDMLGRPGGWTRPPVKPLNAEQRAKIRAVLAQAGLLPAAAAAE